MLHACIVLLLIKLSNSNSSLRSGLILVLISSSSNITNAEPAVQHTQATTLLAAVMHHTKLIRVPAKGSIAMVLCLALAVDVQENTGPRTAKCSCGICKRAARTTDPEVCCDKCNEWIHNSCSDLLKSMYKMLQWCDCVWICPSCGLPNFADLFFNDKDAVELQNNFSTLAVPVPSLVHIHKTATNKTPNTVTVSKTVNYTKTEGRSKASIRLLSVNFNGIKITDKITEFRQLINTVKPDIIAGCESMLYDTILTSESFPPNFNVYRKDRNFFCGGVFIAVLDNLRSQARPDLDTTCDAICAEVSTIKEKPLFTGIDYRPPSETLDLTQFTYLKALSRRLSIHYGSTFCYVEILT